MKPLSPAQQARWIALAGGTAAMETIMLRHQIDFSDNGVVVIWMIAMLIQTAAFRRFISKMTTADDPRSEIEKKFRFFQRIFPPK